MVLSCEAEINFPSCKTSIDIIPVKWAFSIVFFNITLLLLIFHSFKLPFQSPVINLSLIIVKQLKKSEFKVLILLTIIYLSMLMIVI